MRVNAEWMHQRLSAPEEEGGGGFSVHLPTGQQPRSGIMVSLPGRELAVPGVASPEQIQQYASDHENTLTTRRGAFYGGWLDRESNPPTTYLDVSEQFSEVPHRGEGSGEANRAAQARHQLAVYDVAHSDVRDTEDTLTRVTPWVEPSRPPVRPPRRFRQQDPEHDPNKLHPYVPPRGTVYQPDWPYHY